MVNLEKIDVQDYCCSHSFVNEIIENILGNSSELYRVSVIAHGDIIDDIFRQLLSITYTDGCDADVSLFKMTYVHYDADDYDNEYILTVSEDMGIFIEPAWRDNEYTHGYISMESDAIYLHEDADSNILNYIESNYIEIFGFDED